MHPMAAPLPGLRARSLRSAATVAVLAASAITAASCSDEPEPTVANYCAEVQAHLELLTSPSLASGVDIEPMLDRYRGIATLAPATVAPEWAELVTALETASTVVPGDAASIERAIDAALAGQPAYTRIQQYTASACGLAIGTPPTPTNPVTATTPAPATSAVPEPTVAP